MLDQASHLDVSPETVALPEREFSDHYMYMLDMDSITKDGVFAILNSDKNPLSSDKGQELCKTIGHTSMSVGDVIVNHVTDQKWMCVGFGWAELELV